MPAPDGAGGTVGKFVDQRCTCGRPTQHLVSGHNPDAEEFYCPTCHISWSPDEYDPRTHRFRPRISAVPLPEDVPQPSRVQA